MFGFVPPTIFSASAQRESPAADPLDFEFQGFDDYGRYGIGEEDRRKSQMRGIGSLFTNLGQWGMARSMGNRDAQQKIAMSTPGLYNSTVEDDLNNKGQKKLAAALAQLDMSKTLTELEKDELALKMAQEQYEERHESRKIMKDAFEASMPEELQKEMINDFTNPAIRALKASQLASIRAFMELGEPEKAMTVYQQFIADVPEEQQRRWESLQKEYEAKSYGQAAGENRAREDSNSRVMGQFGGDTSGLTRDSRGNLVPMLPSEKREQDLKIRGLELGNAARQSDIDRDRAYIDNLGKESGAQAARQERDIRNALTEFNLGVKRGWERGENALGKPTLFGPDKKEIQFPPSGTERTRANSAMERFEKAAEYLRQFGYDVDSKQPLAYKSGDMGEGGVTGTDDAAETPFSKLRDWYSGSSALQSLPSEALARKIMQNSPQLSMAQALSLATRLKSGG